MSHDRINILSSVVLLAFLVDCADLLRPLAVSKHPELYVKIWLGDDCMGKTRTLKEGLAPQWAEDFEM